MKNIHSCSLEVTILWCHLVPVVSSIIPRNHSDLTHTNSTGDKCFCGFFWLLAPKFLWTFDYQNPAKYCKSGEIPCIKQHARVNYRNIERLFTWDICDVNQLPGNPFKNASKVKIPNIWPLFWNINSNIILLNSVLKQANCIFVFYFTIQ